MKPHLTGSSPRVRGTAGPPSGRYPRGRIIPACAGNGAIEKASSLAATDHPRVCGERSVRASASRNAIGSSPRVRGTAFSHAMDVLEIRIIPACAGNGWCCGWHLHHLSDHPRVCGERTLMATGSSKPRGSSPRVRGTADPAAGVPHVNRIIPACAGNGDSARKTRSPRADHPRVCGERQFVFHGDSVPFGSSPRVRGTACSGATMEYIRRIIPACAGNGRHGQAQHLRAADHPRVCGERTQGLEGRDQEGGSSPRVRGTAREQKGLTQQQRIIPACAGNGSTRWANTGTPTDHPRVCGERSTESKGGGLKPGSSPRVRGTVIEGGAFNARGRIIPACAGNGPGCRPSCLYVPDHPRVCGERPV